MHGSQEGSPTGREKRHHFFSPNGWATLKRFGLFGVVLFLVISNLFALSGRSRPLPPIPPATPTAQVNRSAIGIPNFSHIVMIALENTEFNEAIGNTQEMPKFNQLAHQYTLLSQFYAESHPSLPNYLAMIGGETFGIQDDCEDCFIHAPSLPDLIEASGRTWKSYFEDMPGTCVLADHYPYNQAINPFVYFDPIRLNQARCAQHVVPLTQLDQDLQQGDLANFVYIAPNLCNDGHKCSMTVADTWLREMVNKIMGSTSFDRNSLIILTFDEGDTNQSCCGMGAEAGGHIATVLISPRVKPGFVDNTPYTHYSILKTIDASWGLLDLGHAADVNTRLILAPWENDNVVTSNTLRR